MTVEVLLIVIRTINGADESSWKGYKNETYALAIFEITIYAIGSFGSIFAYWYTYIYFKRVIVALENEKDSLKLTKSCLTVHEEQNQYRNQS